MVELLAVSLRHLCGVMRKSAEAGLVCAKRGLVGGIQSPGAAESTSLLTISDTVDLPPKGARGLPGRGTCDGTQGTPGEYVMDGTARIRDQLAHTALLASVRGQGGTDR
jgi:DNA-binding IscR family transcriptional regulator